jgi:hypothetical protein
MPPIEYEITQMGLTFTCIAKFNSVEFLASGCNKKVSKNKVAENIYNYINDNRNKLKTEYRGRYIPPKKFKTFIFIDLENYTELYNNLDILDKYKDYYIISYLTRSHALMNKYEIISKYCEVRVVDCTYKDAADIQIIIDISTVITYLSKYNMDVIYLITKDHFGKVLNKLLPYCNWINDFDFLFNLNNILLKNNNDCDDDCDNCVESDINNLLN